MCRIPRRASALRRLDVERLETRFLLNAQFGFDSALFPRSNATTAATDGDWTQVAADLAYAHQQLGLTGSGQTVAVIDSGIAYDHAALGGGFGSGYRVVGGWDFTEEQDADPFDDPPAGFHGTHVAGIIGGHDARFVGVAPDADFVALRVFNDQGASDFAWVEKALQWVHDHKNDFASPITTVNLSLGTNVDSRPNGLNVLLDDELAQLHRDGIFVAVAAGNDFRRGTPGFLNYPASNDSVVPVASSGSDGKISPYSQRNPRVLVAPGAQITSTAPDFIDDFNGITDDYLTISGTSSAAPYVAGASVLVRQALHSTGQQDVDQDQIEHVLRRTAREVYDPVTQTTYSHIDLRAALDFVLQPPVRDLGTVDARTVGGLLADVNGSLYKVVTAHDGFLTIQVAAAEEHASVMLDVYDAHQESLCTDQSADEPLRVDLQVNQGQVLFFKLSGEHVPVTVQLTNLVSPQGTQLNVFGTAEADEIRLDVSRNFQLSVNGVEYDLSQSWPTTARIHGSSGADTIHLTASTGAERAVLAPGHLRLEGAGYVVEAWDLETQYVFGAGGHDEAILIDSPGKDFFRGRPDHVLMMGRGYKNYVAGFAVVQASADSGGRDRARLMGSAGNDTLYGFSRDSLMVGDGFRIHVQGFSAIQASASQGGHDEAYLFASRRDVIVRGNRQHRRILIRKDSVRLASGFTQIRLIDSANSRVTAARLGINGLDAEFVDRAFLRAHEDGQSLV